MWVIFISLLNLYIFAKTLETVLHIYDYYKMTKSSEEMAKIWEETIKNECNCRDCQTEIQSTCKGKHAN